MKLVFIDGYPVSDFGVEDFYKTNKTKGLIFTSSSLVLDRFRVAVKEGDIPPFDVEVYDDGELYLLTVDNNGRINQDWPDAIDIAGHLLSRLIW